MSFGCSAQPLQLLPQLLPSPQPHILHHLPDDETTPTTTSYSSLPFEYDDYPLYPTEQFAQHSLQDLEEQDHACMNSQHFPQYPDITVEAYPLPLVGDARHDSVFAAPTPDAFDWPMYQSMGLPASAAHRPFKRARTAHQRTPSASTVASTGPSSPYTTNTFYPQIANTDFSPNSPAQAAYADQALFPKSLATASQTAGGDSFYNYYIPSQAAHTPNAHLAMKGFAIDHHIADDYPAIYQPSRHSMSSHGNNSPATPQSGTGEVYDAKVYAGQNDFRQPPSVQLFRTESQAYQDELYNPQSNHTSTPAAAPKRNPELLTPHRNLINERLQTANMIRGGSPTSAISRERSPFRDGSPFAPTGNAWNSTHMNTASNVRQQQKDEAAQAEYARAMPTLRRSPTKTISPKDAVLDYNETDQQAPLFQDSVPAGYRQHHAGNEAWQNGFGNQSGASYSNLVVANANSQMPAPFRTASADANTEANFGGFVQMPQALPEQVPQVQSTAYQNTSYAVPKMHYVDSTPEFPAHLTSMESSVSEGGPPASSQESFHNAAAIQRPTDTRAHTGAYSCTYHGCTQRFDSHNNLQKHKKDVHRSQPREPTSDETSGSTASPRSTESPAPSTSGMTSAAIQARNSQAGPHKCTRINPSTNKPCNTIFSRPYDLTRHEDTIHNNRKHKVRCPMCREEKTFSRNDALTRHMRVVHPEVETYGKRGRRDS